MILSLCLAFTLKVPDVIDFNLPRTSAEIAKAGFDPARLEAVSKRQKELIDKGVTAGNVTLVIRNGRAVLFDAQGHRDLEARTPMRKDTLFQVMSMTKPVTAAAILICTERGLLNLDDPIEKYLPNFRTVTVKDQPSLDRKPTIRHLLTHTSGLSSNDPAGMDDDQKRKMDLSAYGDLLGKEPLDYQPGSKIVYSGVGFSTMARIVEIASATPFDRFLQQNVFDPLGMKDTFTFLPPTRRPDLAKTYTRSNGLLEEFEHDRFRDVAKFANGAGGLYSTAADMARFIWMFVANGTYNGKRILSPASVEAMTRLQTGDLLMDRSDANGMGWGWAVVRSASGQSTLRPIGSFGHTGAFVTEFWADRPTGLAVVYLSQGFGAGEDARKTFNTMLNAARTR